MIDIKMSICFRFLLNDSFYKWEHLQHEVERMVTRKAVHCIPDSFSLLDRYEGEHQNVDVFYRLSHDKVLELICIGREIKPIEAELNKKQEG